MADGILIGFYVGVAWAIWASCAIRWIDRTFDRVAEKQQREALGLERTEA